MVILVRERQSHHQTCPSALRKNRLAARPAYFTFWCEAPASQQSLTFQSGRRNVSSGAGLALRHRGSTQPQKSNRLAPRSVGVGATLLVYGKPGPQPHDQLSARSFDWDQCMFRAKPGLPASAHGVGLGSASFRRSRPPDFRLSQSQTKRSNGHRRVLCRLIGF